MTPILKATIVNFTALMMVKYSALMQNLMVEYVVKKTDAQTTISSVQTHLVAMLQIG